MNKNNYPRVLIISHNALSDTQSNGKTISGFFKDWDRQNLAQIYLTTDIPDFTICENFFQINDFDIMRRGMFKRNIQGRKVNRSEVVEMKDYKEKVVKNSLLKIVRKNVSPMFRFFRDLMWSFAGFKTKELNKFINEFAPDIVFFQTSNATFAFSLVKWVCKTRGIPLIIQITDDYVTSRFSLDPFFWIQHFRILKITKWAMSYAQYIVAIGDKMVAEYKLRFGGAYFVAMNSVLPLNLPNYRHKSEVMEFVYAGNLVLNRWKMLAIISDCLKDLKYEDGLLAHLSIYSLVPPNEEELSILNNPPFSTYLGAINTNELNDVKAKSDVLVHVEAFDKKNKHITRLSISTKIPEYLASGRCIFAIGPDDVASMEYLMQYDLGFTVNSVKKEEIKSVLREVILDHAKRTKYADNGIKVAAQRHNLDSISEEIYKIVFNAAHSGE